MGYQLGEAKLAALTIKKKDTALPKSVIGIRRVAHIRKTINAIVVTINKTEKTKTTININEGNQILQLPHDITRFNQ